MFGAMLLVHKLPSTIAVVAAAACGDIVALNRITALSCLLLGFWGEVPQNPFLNSCFLFKSINVNLNPFKGNVLFFLSFIAL